MKTELSTFNFTPSLSLRAVTIEGQPWFVAKDVCAVLAITNVSMALRHLEPQEKGLSSIDTPGGAQKTSVISESGLYALIMRSRKPEAQTFRKWVTSVVLPAIRKDGGYVMGEEKVATGEMSDDELVARAMVVMQNKLKRLEEERAKLLPAAESYDRFLATDGTETITEVAKNLGKAPRLFAAQLVADKVLYRRSDSAPLLPHQDHVNNGRFVVRQAHDRCGTLRPQVRVTAKGIDWLARRYPA